MKLFKTFILWFVATSFAALPVWCSEDTEKVDDNNLTLGMTFYNEGNYKEAASHLKKAACANNPIAQQQYADICYRQLDGKPHPLKKAAMYYLLSAYNENPQTFSYLKTIIPNIFENSDCDAQMISIVRNWVIKKTISELKPLRPNKINDFLISTFNRKIDKTTSQKLPYIFDKAMVAIVCTLLEQAANVVNTEGCLLSINERKAAYTNLTDQIATFIDEEVCPLPSSQDMEEICAYSNFANVTPSLLSIKATSEAAYASMKQEENESCDFSRLSPSRSQTNNSKLLSPIPSGLPYSKEHHCLSKSFINFSVSSFVYGPVYYHYFKYLKEGFLELSESTSSLPIFYQLLLMSINEKTKDMSASQLRNLTHRDYPWLLAGIKFWKEKNQNNNLNIIGYSDNDLIEKLNNMNEEIPNEIIEQILAQIDGRNNEYIWPNNGTHPISKEYSENLRIFFSTPISRENDLIRSIQIDFFNNIKYYKLDLSKNETNLQNLETPILMFSCETLELINLESSQKHYNALSTAQRYFTNLQQFTVSTSSEFDSNSNWGKKIDKIILKIKKRFELS